MKKKNATGTNVTTDFNGIRKTCMHNDIILNRYPLVGGGVGTFPTE